MKNLKYLSLTTALVSGLLMGLTACGSDDEESKDMEKPVITTDGIVACPLDCDVFRRGDVIPFNYAFTDNVELARYTIHIHNNFDHHEHPGLAEMHCEMEPQKDPVNPWTVEETVYTIPAGNTRYTARLDIPIPTDIDPGDYHLSIRVFDAKGWSNSWPVSFKIAE